MENFGILENWSPRRGGRLREVVATGGSTVSKITILEIAAGFSSSIVYVTKTGTTLTYSTLSRKLNRNLCVDAWQTGGKLSYKVTPNWKLNK